MKSISGTYIESIVGTLSDILLNLYHGMVVDKVMCRYEIDELALAQKEIDEKTNLFKTKIYDEFEERLEDCLAYTIIKHNEFYFNLPFNYVDETPKCLNGEIEVIIEDVFGMSISNIIPQNVVLRVNGNQKNANFKYAKYLGTVVETQHEKIITNEKYEELEK